ncbi:MAG: radical SAM protein [Candidatus Heimdallarchaeaceae archaeon]|jgi:pyruvate formate lyase activating enzyme
MSEPELHEAEYYEILNEEEQIVQCKLCPFECKLEPGESGICKARKNFFGKLSIITYGYVEMKIDLIEKQYVYHFFPNSRAQTFSTFNCNLDCDHCTAANRVQINPEDINVKSLTPDQAVMFGMASGSKTICFGDSEPLVSFEWVRDTAKLAKEKGLKVLLRTNGFFNEAPILEILEYVDAVKIDLKASNNEDYLKQCGGGNLNHIKKIIKMVHEKEKLLELSLLIHEAFNNKEEAARETAKWIMNELSADVPLHLSRLKPAHRTMNLLPTSLELMESTYAAAKDTGLEYVYLDNVPDHSATHTYCPQCGEEVITRSSVGTEVRRITFQGTCNKCQAPLNIVMF